MRGMSVYIRTGHVLNLKLFLEAQPVALLRTQTFRNISEHH